MLLITGGAGYIASCAVLEFSKTNDVVIFDNLSTGHIETVEALKKINPKIRFEKGDLTNFSDIKRVFEKYDIKGVIHFAGFSLVSESVKNPVKYYKNNIKGSYNLFKTMVEHDVLKIVFSSSAAVYGSPQSPLIDESCPTCPINPYGISKLTVEKILKNFDKNYGLKSVCLRYFNVIGADSLGRIGEWHEPETHIVPNVLKAIIKKENSVKVFGNDYKTKDGSCLRDYINVEDLVRAHVLAFEYLEKENKSDVFNLGANNSTSVFEIIELSKKITGSDIKIEIAPRRAGDPDILCANSARANKILKWYPEKAVMDSIKTAYDWEKSRTMKF